MVEIIMKGMYRRIIFVDYENVQKVRLEHIDREATLLHICIGQGQNKIPFELVQNAQKFGEHVVWMKIEGSGKNNLDFHIAYSMGVYDHDTDIDTEFILLSKDKGFDALLKYISGRGRPCRRVESLVEVRKGAPEPKKPSQEVRRPVQEPKRPLPETRRVEPEARRPLPESRRPEPPAVRAPPEKRRPEPEPKRPLLEPRKPVTSPPAFDALGKVIESLRRMHSNRPRTPKTLAKCIDALSKTTGHAMNPLAIIEELVRTRMITVENNKVSYRL